VLLRVVQEGEIQRVGADRPIHVDVRIVAATNRELAAEVAHGRFRADLYHRLDVFPLRVPPLRERRSDIAILAGFFLDRHRVQLGLSHATLAPAALAALEAADWPGNVRELDHALARAVLRAKLRAKDPGATRVDTVRINAVELDGAAPVAAAATTQKPEAVRGQLAHQVARGTLSLQDAVEDFKRAAVTAALDDTGGNWAEAARRLGMNRSNLHHMARRLRVMPRSRS